MRVWLALSAIGLGLAALVVLVLCSSIALQLGSGAPPVDEGRRLIEVLGSDLRKEREYARRVLMESGDRWLDLVTQAANDPDPKRAANARHILYRRTRNQPDVSWTLRSIAKECGPGWRKFSWAATAFLDDLFDGTAWTTTVACLDRQGLRPAQPARDIGTHLFHYYGTGVDGIAVPPGTTLVIRFQVHAERVVGAHVGIVGPPALLESNDATVAFLPALMQDERIQDKLGYGWVVESCEITAGRVRPQGSREWDPNELGGGFDVLMTAREPNGAAANWWCVALSDLGPLEDWRSRLDGRGPPLSDTIGGEWFSGATLRLRP